MSAFPEGRLGFAVGDIHGRADLLARMFDALEREALSTKRPYPPFVVFLGDYIDRGPDSAEVIDLMLTGRPEGFERRYLKGNHEAAMLSFLDDPVGHKAWLAHGGLETLASYDLYPLPSMGASNDQLLEARDRFKAKLPNTHLAFLQSLERYVVLGDYAFVHAGVDVKHSLEQQTDANLFWIRERFLNETKPFSYRVVHGHTPTTAPFIDRRRIGVDTGAYFSNILSAARFEGDQVRFVAVSTSDPFSRF